MAGEEHLAFMLSRTKRCQAQLCRSVCPIAGAVLHRTLTALGAGSIQTYFLPKGDNIHSADATKALSAYSYEAAAFIVLDQGSRAGPPILPGVPTLILDHHQSLLLPEGAQMLQCSSSLLHGIQQFELCHVRVSPLLRHESSAVCYVSTCLQNIACQ